MEKSSQPAPVGDGRLLFLRRYHRIKHLREQNSGLPSP